jgi:hypothetical protein
VSQAILTESPKALAFLFRVSGRTFSRKFDVRFEPDMIEAPDPLTPGLVNQQPKMALWAPVRAADINRLDTADHPQHVFGTSGRKKAGAWVRSHPKAEGHRA